MMNKFFMIMAVILVIFLAGCSKEETTSELPESATEAVGDEESEISTAETTVGVENEVSTEETSGSVENEASTEATSSSEGALSSEENSTEAQLVLELKMTDNPRIAEILNISGTYTDGVGNTDSYSYQIPQFNADSDSARAVNKKIVDDLYDIISEEVNAISGGYSLYCYNITYEVIEYENIVAILVSVPYPNDCVAYYAYSYDFENNKEVTNTELLAMNEMTEAELNAIMQPAIDATTVDLPMYIGTDGTLNVYVPFPSVAGAEWYYGLDQF